MRAEPLVDLEEPLDLVHDAIEVPRLAAAGRLLGVAVHRVALPHDAMTRPDHGLDDRRQQLADEPVAHPRDERHAAVDSLRIEPLDELDRVRGRGRGAELHPDRVGDDRAEGDVGAVELARTFPYPGQVGREQEQAIALRPQQRPLIVEYEHLVTGVQLDRAQRAVFDATGRHEPQAPVDLVGDSLVALAGARAAHEVHVPLVQVMEIRQAGSRDRARQVHCRRRVGVRADQPAGVWPPRLGRRLEAVDHVAAV